MVFERKHIILITLHVGLLIEGHACQSCFAITHAVAFNIGFGNNVKTVLVAKVVPAGIIRVVARTHSVNVVLLHDADVLNHAFDAHKITSVGIHLVTVGTLNEYGLTVHQELTTLNLQVAETHLLLDALQDLAVLVREIHAEGIEIGRFSCPSVRLINGKIKLLCAFRHGGSVCRSNHFALGVRE